MFSAWTMLSLQTSACYKKPLNDFIHFIKTDLDKNMNTFFNRCIEEKKTDMIHYLAIMIYDRVNHLFHIHNFILEVRGFKENEDGSKKSLYDHIDIDITKYYIPSEENITAIIAHINSIIIILEKMGVDYSNAFDMTDEMLDNIFAKLFPVDDFIKIMNLCFEKNKLLLTRYRIVNELYRCLKSLAEFHHTGVSKDEYGMSIWIHPYAHMVPKITLPAEASEENIKVICSHCEVLYCLISDDELSNIQNIFAKKKAQMMLSLELWTLYGEAIPNLDRLMCDTRGVDFLNPNIKSKLKTIISCGKNPWFRYPVMQEDFDAIYEYAIDHTDSWSDTSSEGSFYL